MVLAHPGFEPEFRDSESRVLTNYTNGPIFICFILLNPTSAAADSRSRPEHFPSRKLETRCTSSCTGHPVHGSESQAPVLWEYPGAEAESGEGRSSVLEEPRLSIPSVSPGQEWSTLHASFRTETTKQVLRQEAPVRARV